MDPSSKFQGGTWHRYKLGQAQFTKWLKQTADRLTAAAAVPTIHGPASPVTVTGSSEKTAKARKKKPADQPASAPGVDAKVEVHWSQLEKMAASIVEHARPEDIPAASINILRDVIGLRKKSASFFRQAAAQNEGDEEMQQRNATHDHIIKVLESVLDKFNGLMAKAHGVKAAWSGSSTKMDVDDLSNMFEHLELQMPPDIEDDDDENVPETASQGEHPFSKKTKAENKKKGAKHRKGKKTNKASSCGPSNHPLIKPKPDSSWMDTVDFGFSQDDDYDEADDYYMMIYCFFEDFNVIRSYVCERWCDYYVDRSVPLDTLAVITNAAFEIFHHLELDLVVNLRRMGIRDPTMGSYESMMMMLFAEVGMEHIDYESYQNLSKEEADMRMWQDEWEWLASPAFTSIQAIVGMIPPGKTPMIRPEDRTRAVYGGTTAEELNRFKDVVTTDLMLEVVCVKALKTNGLVDDVMPAESEVMLGFQDALWNYDWSSAFVFSLQMYIDIRAILEDTVSHPFEQLQKTAQNADCHLRDRVQEATGPRGTLRRAMRQRQREVDRFMIKDVIMEDKRPRYHSKGIDNLPDFFLLKHEPVWAGLLDFRAKLFMSEIGHEFVHRSYLLEAAAYLYAAARAVAVQFSEHAEFPAWPMMNKYLNSYEDDSPFKRGILSAGNDPVRILRNFKEVRPEDVTKVPRASRSLDEVDGQTESWRQALYARQLLSWRYTVDDRRKQFSTRYLSGLVELHIAAEIEKSEPEPVLRETSGNKQARPASFRETSPSTAVVLEDSAPSQAQSQADAVFRRKRKAMLAQLLPLQMIQILEETVTSQLDGLLSIDFFSLWNASKAMLCSTCMKLGSHFHEHVGYNTGDLPDLLAKVPLLLGDELTGDLGKDETALMTMMNATKQALQESLKPQVLGMAEGAWEAGSRPEDGNLKDSPAQNANRSQ